MYHPVYPEVHICSMYICSSDIMDAPASDEVIRSLLALSWFPWPPPIVPSCIASYSVCNLIVPSCCHCPLPWNIPIVIYFLPVLFSFSSFSSPHATGYLSFALAFDYQNHFLLLSKLFIMHPSSSSSFGARIRPSRRLPLLSKNRPPPLKSCLAASDSDRDSTPPEEPVRKTVRFPDDKLFLEQVRTIPARPDRTKKAIFKRGQVAETKSFIMYTSNPSSTNQRFLSKLPGSSGPRYENHSQWMSVVRARYLAAAYVSEPRSPRSAPSSDESAFDMSSLKDALTEPASGSSVHGSDFDMSSLADALPDPNDTFNMRSLMDALPEAAPKPCGFASDMSSLKRALPDPDAPSEVSSLAPAPKSMVAPHSRDLPPKVHVRAVQTHVQVGPFSTTCFFNLCGLCLVLGSFFPCLAPALYAAFALLSIYGTCFF